MRRLISASGAGLVLSAALLTSAGAPAGHADTCGPFTASAGPRFNDPTGSTDDQLRVMGPVIDAINSSCSGQTVRVAMYSISTDSPGPEFADALIAAHQRGVTVQALMDQHSDNAVWQRIAAELGTNARLCPGGCLTHYAGSSLHAKYYLFSGGGDTNRTVVVSSANPTGAQAHTAWNSSYTTKGNTALYNSYVAYFNAMFKGAAGTKQTDWYSGSSATKARSLAPPSYQWPKSSSKSDTWVDLLNNVKAPATLNVAMYEWTTGQQAVASKLVALGKTGVKVHVLYAADAVDASVRSYLAGKTNVDVHDTSTGKDANGNALHYTHDKFMAVSGTYAGVKGSKLVFVGSSNWTTNGIYHNDETDVKVTGAATYQLFLDNWQAQFDACCGTATLRSRAAQRAEGDAPVIPIDPDQKLED